MSNSELSLPGTAFPQNRQRTWRGKKRRRRKKRKVSATLYLKKVYVSLLCPEEMGIHEEVQEMQEGDRPRGLRAAVPTILQPNYGSKCHREGRKQQGRQSARGLRRVGTSECPVHPKEKLAYCLHRFSSRIGNGQKRGRRWGKGGSGVRGNKAAKNKSRKADAL